jgi:hypothetical protein
MDNDINDLTRLRDHSIVTVAQWVRSYCLENSQVTPEQARAQIPNLIRTGVLEIVEG